MITKKYETGFFSKYTGFFSE
jgi:hypothetical protein